MSGYMASCVLARLHSEMEVYHGHQIKCVSLEELGNLGMYMLTMPQVDELMTAENLSFVLIRVNFEM